MSRLSPGQEESTTPGAQGRWRRLAPILAVAAVLVVLAGCSPTETQIYSTISPQTNKADDIQFLYKIIFWAALIVFIAVQAAIAYTVIRFRRRGEGRPEQVHGSRTLEIAWTVIPAIILLVIFIPTAQTIFKHAAAEKAENAFHIEVIGKQWWWEVHYPDIPANPDQPDAGPLTTANEIIIPVGSNVVINLDTNNVIHSFWVPQLSGKLDLIPGHDNRLQFDARQVGEYFGECAEFCGSAHAWMRFKIKVVPQEAFDAWVAAWRTPPADANPDTADVVEVPPAFGACLACHRVNGTNAMIAPQGISANPGYEDPETHEAVPGPGPNLTLLACRDTIAAGLLKNTPENLDRWIKHTDQVKEGTYMPNYYQNGQGLKDEQVAELVKYLSGLKPAAGCPTNGLPIAGVVEQPAATPAP
ncbi:MAG: cytochrome c oxidase subunit II [Thermomicrobiales bacterium]